MIGRGRTLALILVVGEDLGALQQPLEHRVGALARVGGLPARGCRELERVVDHVDLRVEVARGDIHRPRGGLEAAEQPVVGVVELGRAESGQHDLALADLELELDVPGEHLIAGQRLGVAGPGSGQDPGPQLSFDDPRVELPSGLPADPARLGDVHAGDPPHAGRVPAGHHQALGDGPLAIGLEDRSRERGGSRRSLASAEAGRDLGLAELPTDGDLGRGPAAVAALEDHEVARDEAGRQGLVEDHGGGEVDREVAEDLGRREQLAEPVRAQVGQGLERDPSPEAGGEGGDRVIGWEPAAVEQRVVDDEQDLELVRAGLAEPVAERLGDRIGPDAGRQHAVGHDQDQRMLGVARGQLLAGELHRRAQVRALPGDGHPERARELGPGLRVVGSRGPTRAEAGRIEQPLGRTREGDRVEGGAGRERVEQPREHLGAVARQRARARLRAVDDEHDVIGADRLARSEPQDHAQATAAAIRIVRDLVAAVELRLGLAGGRPRDSDRVLGPGDHVRRALARALVDPKLFALAEALDQDPAVVDEVGDLGVATGQVELPTITAQVRVDPESDLDLRSRL